MNFYVSRSGVHFSPSKRILTKIIFVLLAIIAIFFFSIFDVNAATYYSPSSYWNDNQQCQGGVTCQNQVNIPSSGSKSTLFAAIYSPNSIPVGTYGGYLNLWVSENPMSGFYFSNITASIKLGNDTTIQCSSTSASCRLTTETITESSTYSTLHVMLTFSFYNSGNMEIYIGQNATARGNPNSGHTYTWRMNSQVEKISDSDTIGVNQFNSAMSDVNKNLSDFNNSINDDNISTEQKGDSANFFLNFSDRDNGGLSSILTAPIRAVQSMLSNTCTPLTATYKGKEIRFECGTYWWNKMPQIKSWLNVIYDGLLCFYILKAFYNEIQRLKDPDDESRVEVIDL